MSESPFVAFLAMYGFYMTRWVQDTDKLRFLFLAAITVFLATLTRYEGWALLLIAVATVTIVCTKHRFGFHKTLAHLQFFGAVAFFGIILWMLWNLIIFNDVLFFTRSEFSAGQIAERTFAGLDSSLQTKGNLLFDLRIWGKTSYDIIGPISIALATLGLVAFVFSKRSALEKLVGVSLLYPTFFYILTMFIGVSTVIWHPDYFDGQNWGTRYATLMLPAVGLFAAYLVANWGLIWKTPVVAVLVLSFVLTWQGGLLTVHEAKTYPLDPATQVRNRLAHWFDESYDHGLVLMYRVGNERLLFASEIPLKKVVYEGSEPDFRRLALIDPVEASIDWIVMWKNLNGKPDQVWESLRDTTTLEESYYLIYKEADVEVYKIKPGMDKKSLAGKDSTLAND